MLTRFHGLLLTACLWAGGLASGCVSEPRIEETGLLASARRLLAVEASPRAARRKIGELTYWRRQLAAEASRLPRLARRPGPPLRDEFGRVARLSGRARELADAARRRLPPNVGVLLPDPAELGRELAEDTAFVMLMFGAGKRPLGEYDDREHRTDFRDDRPEATLWQRIARRLRLRL